MVNVTLLSLLVLTGLAAALPSAAPSSQRKAPAKIPSKWKQLDSAPVASDSYEFTFALEPADDAGLTAKMEEIVATDGEWLTVEQLKQYASPTEASTAAVTSYLKSMGISESQMSFNTIGDKLTVKSDIATTEKLFSTTLLHYSLDGAKVARAHAFTIPSAIADHVQDVYPLANFQVVKKTSAPFVPLEDDEAELLKRQSTSGCSTSSVTPACLRNLYGTSSFTPASGSATVGVIGYIGQSVSQTDLTNFLTTYRPDAKSYQIPIKTSRGATNNQNSPGVEAMLDVETVVSATYPLGSTFYDIGTASTSGDLFGLTFGDFVSSSSRPGVISISYGSDESDMTSSQATTMCNNAKQLTALGTTIVVSSGDYGVSGQQGDTCPPFVPTYPGGCQYVLSVGATQSFSPEVMVDTNLAGFYSGAGRSNFFATPSFQSSQVSSYQSSISTSTSYYNTGGRSFPDVAAQGSKYVIIYGGKSGTVGGTSASAPTVASIITLLNSARNAAGKGTVGWIHPTIYGSPSSFNDVTSGGSYGCGSSSQGFPAVSGFDTPSGLGTPKFSSLRTLFGA